VARVEVDIPDPLLIESAVEELKSLRAQVKRLEVKVKKLEGNLAKGKEAVEQALNLRLYIMDNYSFYTDPWDE